MNPTAKRFQWILVLMLILILPIAIAGIHTVHADQPLIGTETAQLNAGDSLVVHSDKMSIQQVFIDGNLSVANFTQPAQYPTNNFQITASTAGLYQIRVIFDQPTSYNVNVFVRSSQSSIAGNSTSYYVSGGSLELDLTVNFNPNPDTVIASTPSVSPWDGFIGWMNSFGQAFPVWVKLLYLLFGVQFFAVGGLWIRRESKRKEQTAQRLDIGDQVYLWLDLAYKFLLASFVAIVVIMGGELILLFVLRFMFLASFSLLSLWDLFVVGFAAGAVIIMYIIRFSLEKGFDLKPMGDE